MKVKELRVVGARIQVQPAAVNEAGAKGTETAFLFDYETDYEMKLNDVDIKSKRQVSARIDGTGLVIGNKVRWVQVPSGIRELAIVDPGLWEIGTLGKILKIVDIKLRREPHPELILTLRLSGNLGIITAGDFVFAIDLKNSDFRMEAFPSKLSLEIPSTLKGEGIFVIDKNEAEKDIRGSIDLTLIPFGLRFFAGARVSRLTDTVGPNATAMLATAKVEFASMIPLASSGLGLKEFDGVYAAHFRRLEASADPGTPPALKWLKQVDGNVVTSVTAHPKRWAVAYDHWSFALGVALGLQANRKLFNLNSMLMLELPGPRILVFSKANLFKEPRANEEARNELDTGVLGVLEIDVQRKEMTFAALVDLRFEKYLTIRAPLELFFTLQKLSSWHLHIGHFDNKVSATLEVEKLLSLKASGYFMAAGDAIENAPLLHERRDLPGFALALGVAAYVKIGSGSLYLRVDLRNYLSVSLGDDLYAIGGVGLSGELRLFIVSIGVSSTLQLEFLKLQNGNGELFIDGEICGSVRLLFIKLSGCVSLSIGTRIPDTVKLPPLVESVSIIAGTDVALRGQGALGPVDAVIASEDLSNKANASISAPIPLDAVISVSMATAPLINGGANSFAIPQPNQNETKFQIGEKSGQYVLQKVVLEWKQNDGWKNVEYKNLPATWWLSTQSSAGGQPIPRELALLTRNPLAVKNAVAGVKDLEAWINEVLGGVCSDAIGRQSCLYFWDASDIGQGVWTLPAVLCDQKTENKIGRSGATSLKVSLETPTDPIADYPFIVGSCVGAHHPDTENPAPVPVLRLISYRLSNPRNELITLASEAQFRANILVDPNAPLEFILAHRTEGPFNDDFGEVTTNHHLKTVPINIRIKYRDGHEKNFPPNNNAVTVKDLLDADVQKDFHRKCENWKDSTEAFCHLADTPEFAGARFVNVQIQLDSNYQSDRVNYATEVTISMNTDAKEAMVFVGAIKYTPHAEHVRWENDKEHKNSLIENLQEFLTLPEIPLLEPNSQYRVNVEWETDGDNDKVLRQSKKFDFNTTDQPPDSALPYLLTVFPQPNEQFHYADDIPGFALASTDLFRMLGKFPSARIRVTITEDGGNKVYGADGMKWHEGVLINPLDLINPDRTLKGIITKRIASLPSAVRQVILAKIASKELSCLGEDISLPENGGIWIGFDAYLRPISGYAIRLDIVNEKGEPWPFPAGDTNRGDDAFLSWRFRTALHRNLEVHATELSGATIRHRLLESDLDVYAKGVEVDDLDGIRVVAEKEFEDAFASALGERPDKSGETLIIVLWKRIEDKVIAHSVLIESKEPILRRTETVAIQRKMGTVLIAEKEEKVLQLPILKRSKGVSKFCMSASSFSLWAEIDHESSEDVKIVIAQREVDRIVRNLHEEQMPVLKRTMFSNRTIPIAEVE